jgi:hypothetical protein
VNSTTATPQPPERIYNWIDSQLSLARYWGGLNFQGHHYSIAYNEPGQPLVRHDVLAQEAKAAKAQARAAAKAAKQAAAQAQAALHLPSEDTEGGHVD